MMELVKQWIEKTKQEVGEREREQKVKTIFEAIFGVRPEKTEWERDGVNRIIVATTKVKVEENHILGERVDSVIFGVKEDISSMQEHEWKLSQFTRAGKTVYKWRKYLKGYIAFTEILIE